MVTVSVDRDTDRVHLESFVVGLGAATYVFIDVKTI